jgi:hypothetical protein
MICSLVLQTTLIFPLIVRQSPERWLAYVIFLIMVGGILIIFIYLSALVPNELFFTLSRIKFVFIPTLWIYLFANISPSMPRTPNVLISPLLKFRHLRVDKTTIIVLIYLLLCIFVVIFLRNKLKTPIKIKTYDFITKNSPPTKNYK